MACDEEITAHTGFGECEKCRTSYCVRCFYDHCADTADSFECPRCTGEIASDADLLQYVMKKTCEHRDTLVREYRAARTHKP